MAARCMLVGKALAACLSARFALEACRFQREPQSSRAVEVPNSKTVILEKTCIQRT